MSVFFIPLHSYLVTPQSPPPIPPSRWPRRRPAPPPGLPPATGGRRRLRRDPRRPRHSCAASFTATVTSPGGLATRDQRLAMAAASSTRASLPLRCALHGGDKLLAGLHRLSSPLSAAQPRAGCLNPICRRPPVLLRTRPRTRIQLRGGPTAGGGTPPSPHRRRPRRSPSLL
jgi:hypothetical protein